MQGLGRGLDWLGQVRHDARFAFRALRRDPAFAAVAVLTVALGIGANAAIFSVVRGVLLRPLPFPNPDELVRVWSVHTGDAASARGATGAADAAHGPAPESSPGHGESLS